MAGIRRRPWAILVKKCYELGTSVKESGHKELCNAMHVSAGQEENLLALLGTKNMSSAVPFQVSPLNQSFFL